MITKEKVYSRALFLTVLVLFLILISSTVSSSTVDYNSTFYEPVLSEESVMEYFTPNISVECEPNNNEDNSAEESICNLSVADNSENSVKIACNFTKASGNSNSVQNSSVILSPGEAKSYTVNPGDNLPTGNTKVKVTDNITNEVNFYHIYVNNDGTINLPTKILEEEFNSDNEEDGTETDNRIEITIKESDEAPEPILPVANFTCDVTTGGVPLSVQFTDLSENVDSVNWDFGDGATSIEQSPVHTYYVARTYTVNLTASNTNGTSSKSTTINVLKATPEVIWNNPADIIYGTELSSTQLSASASLLGSFVYTPEAGTVMSAGMQTLHVDFTPEDAENYTAASKEITINVLRSTPAITWSNPAAIIYGTALSETQLNADASVPGSFVYNPVSGTILGAGDQTLQTTFTPADSANYTTAEGSVSLTVNKAAPLITWNNLADIVYGTPLSETQLNASSSVDGAFIYTPPSETVLGAGKQTLNVDFTPTDIENYTAASTNVIINVLKVTPEVIWSDPADIIYGTTLNITQLNASASVPGTFVYTPPSGTVLSAGTQTLKVEFTPEDAENYNTVSKEVTIDVLTPVQKIEQITATVQDLVTSGVLNKGQGNALIVKLNAAEKNLNKENTNAAINELNAFINQVNAYIKSGKLSPTDGQELIDDANSVINVLKTS